MVNRDRRAIARKRKPKKEKTEGRSRVPSFRAQLNKPGGKGK